MNNRAYIFGGLAGTLVVIAFVFLLSSKNETSVHVADPMTVHVETPVPPAPSPAVDEPLITITAPTSHSVITSPTSLTGKARGYWFFEGSFPVELRDGSGNVVATSVAQADGEWMTENFVQFTSTLSGQQQQPPAVCSSSKKTIHPDCQKTTTPCQSQCFSNRVELR